MKTVICAIAKQENNYINDGLNYHLNLGFDHIYIYDNNDEDYEPIEQRIEQLDKVTIFKIPGMKEFQTKCYTDFYTNYKSTFDWCAFIDIDEFITLNKGANINEFLLDNMFKDHECVRLNMTCISDDELIERDVSIPVYEALKNRCNIDWLDFGGKQIIRGNLDNMVIDVHYPKQNGKPLNDQITPSGRVDAFKERINERNDNAYIRHYRTKTLSEFVKNKLGKTDGCFESIRVSINYYFDSNKKTEEKVKWLEEHGISCSHEGIIMKKEQEPLVSIIIPVYNQEKLILRCLNSIPFRDDIEIIIVDDASTDNTLNVLKDYNGDYELKIVHFNKNFGAGHGVNAGINIANGKYICRVDSDDYLITGNFNDVIDKFIVHNDYDFVTFDRETNTSNLSKSSITSCDCTKFIKRSGIGSNRYPNTLVAEDFGFGKFLLEDRKDYSYADSRIIAYHYNYPREGSLSDLRSKGVLKDSLNPTNKVFHIL